MLVGARQLVCQTYWDRWILVITVTNNDLIQSQMNTSMLLLGLTRKAGDENVFQSLPESPPSFQLCLADPQGCWTQEVPTTKREREAAALEHWTSVVPRLSMELHTCNRQDNDKMNETRCIDATIGENLSLFL